MKQFGLIGNPIAGSKSPALFNAGYSGRYRYDLIEGEFEQSYGKFIEEYDGINVTAPFKELAYRRADKKSGIVEKTKASNLLVKTADGITAYNTDFYGIVLSALDALLPEGGYGYFQRHGTDFSHIKDSLPEIYGYKPTALVVGCGGAGRAAALAAAEMGYRTMLVNRSKEKAEAIADEMPGYGFIAGELSDFTKLFTEADLVIYTIPEKIALIDELRETAAGGNNTSGKEKIVIEANYKTPALKDIACGGKYRYISGKKWLLYQALTGYCIFTGEQPDFVKMEGIL